MLRRERLKALANPHATRRTAQQTTQQGGRFADIELEQHGLDRADRGRRERKRAVTDREERERPDWFRGELAAQRHRLGVGTALVGAVGMRSSGLVPGPRRACFWTLLNR